MLGFGKKGDINLKIEKTHFSPGETITGAVSLKLKKPQKAKGFSVIFYGEEEINEYDEQGMQKTDRNKVYEFAHSLDEEKEYQAGEELSYNFEIKIPADILMGTQAPEGVLGKIAQVAKYMSGRRGIIYWYLMARLDIPWGRDVIKKIKITVG
ncbi:MAG: hypothetical protein KAS39_03490 [Actinomycetia bacterium]|nr:hypothetical protein [Actinomycetes bacterium]